MKKTAEMVLAHGSTHGRKGVALGMALGLGFFSIAPVMAQTPNPPTRSLGSEFKSGNAATECAQIGEYAYSLKIAEGRGEGAPNGSETYTDGTHSNTITIANSTGKVFDWSSNPNGIGAVIVKAGNGANVWEYKPQVKSDGGLFGPENKDISHVTFCWNLDEPVVGGEWCSPGYWRQPQHLDSWPATGFSTTDLFSAKIGYTPTRNRQGVNNNAPTNPTLINVLNFPQYYGGDAFNAVGDLLSRAHPDVNFAGERVEDSCPLN